MNAPPKGFYSTRERAEYCTQLAKMSFDEILLDLTGVVRTVENSPIPGVFYRMTTNHNVLPAVRNDAQVYRSSVPLCLCHLFTDSIMVA